MGGCMDAFYEDEKKKAPQDRRLLPTAPKSLYVARVRYFYAKSLFFNKAADVCVPAV
jgi:hypothetical protein